MPTPLLDERGQSHKIIIPCILDNKGVHTFARFVMNVERTQLYRWIQSFRRLFQEFLPPEQFVLWTHARLKTALYKELT
ncbi:hypothetical protein E4U45_006168 [Claviceps purpurea]|nr:hypothetical protein E4U45_006168 [Claviceps purpurea]